jgi:PHD/YefM family antitoxin component YafN of YafNO toxin-antitoxin module
MASAGPKPKYVVDENGKTSAVVLSVRDYERLLAAWEEVADAADFAAARKSARKFVSAKELRRRVMQGK